MTREALVTAAREAGLSTAPVCTVSEVARSAQVAAREIIVEKSSADGRKWPLLASPLRLARTGAVVQRPIGELGEANDELRSLVQNEAGNASVR
jgi:crotonobetainyl-CoA:carnitine CoA-transferase CaiB-like acyl-CoA transferase